MEACPDARVAVSEDQGEAEGHCCCHQRRVRIRIAEGEARLVRYRGARFPSAGGGPK